METQSQDSTQGKANTGKGLDPSTILY